MSGEAAGGSEEAGVMRLRRVVGAGAAEVLLRATITLPRSLAAFASYLYLVGGRRGRAVAE
jgi:hypothetical protein